MKILCALLIIAGGLYVYDMPPERVSKPRHATDKCPNRRSAHERRPQNYKNRFVVNIVAKCGCIEN